MIDDKISFDNLYLKRDALSLFLKDEALNYINLTGTFPLFELGLDATEISHKSFLSWLGINRCQKIKKLCFNPFYNGIKYIFPKLNGINFICPNLEEISLSYHPDSREYILEIFPLYPNLKIIKFADIRGLFFEQYFEALSKLKKLEELELNFLEFYRFENSSRNLENCLEVLKKIPIIENITKLKIYTHNEINPAVDKICAILFTKLPNLIELDVPCENCVEYYIDGHPWDPKYESLEKIADLKKIK